MEEMDIINILENLVDEEFKKFKWHLKNEKVDDIEPIHVHVLSRAEREEVVDLMVQKYQLSGAVGVMTNVLKKISRNDLVTKISKMESGPAAGPCRVPPGVPACRNTAEDKLKTVRSQFIDRVSVPVVYKLLDHLLDGGMINEGEMEVIGGTGNRADKARAVIDTVRRKGPAASSVLISALREVDPCLSKELNLM
ncbi:Caspase-1 [Channa argus]|uniref:Caspase-1 n=1 Tax=Channa argus TaxID=215402 RepID=A0A6G1QMJ2_CHAAH|nr:Caspase-1 [Channa argus]